MCLYVRVCMRVLTLGTWCTAAPLMFCVTAVIPAMLTGIPAILATAGEACVNTWGAPAQKQTCYVHYHSQWQGYILLTIEWNSIRLSNIPHCFNTAIFRVIIASLLIHESSCATVLAEQHEQGPKTPRPITGNLYGVGTELWGGGVCWYCFKSM